MGLLGAFGAACIALFLFPGQRLAMAFRLGTGLALGSLQTRIDTLESKAILREPFSATDKEFLTDFYRTLATGAKLTVVVGQTGRMMDHYLDGSGSDYRLDPRIFVENRKVLTQMAALRTAGASCAHPERRFSSPRFYMPDASKVDSVFGLYYGTLQVVPARSAEGQCILHWRAEVPWTWPSYESLRAKYGNYHAESFPLPNLKSLLEGERFALFVDNGLGEYLAELGLAKVFVAYAEWDEAPP